MDDFLSGEHGHVAGRIRQPLRRAADRALDVWLRASHPLRGVASPPRTVVVAAVGSSDLLERALGELRRSIHHVRVVTGPTGGGGKFQNLNALLADAPPADWLLVVDDDVVLPSGFLDRFVAVCERLGFDLAQPAQTLASHAAWRFARRRPFSVARQTNFVEIGPVTAFSRAAADVLLPFPDLRYGWGLDAHWAALAAERGWKLGIVDALPVRHESRRVAAGYATDAAVSEAREFLGGRSYLRAADAGRTLHLYRRLPA
jgi:Glycosyltransferase like family 2